MNIAPTRDPKPLKCSDFFDQDFRREMDNFFGGHRPRYCPSERAWNPPTDIFETRDAIHIRMELAGVRETDVEVKVSDKFLIVRGRRCDEANIKKENFHLMEVQFGAFQRVFGLPEHMEVRDVSAELQNGFLLVSIPKDHRIHEFRIEVE
jgi:HSP20 family protein